MILFDIPNKEKELAKYNDLISAEDFWMKSQNETSNILVKQKQLKRRIDKIKNIFQETENVRDLIELSKLENEQQIVNMAHQIVDDKKSVREVEEMAQGKEIEHKVKMNRRKEKSTEYKYVEELLHDKLDTKVRIKERKIEISFTNKADLNRILEILQVKE